MRTDKVEEIEEPELEDEEKIEEKIEVKVENVEKTGECVIPEYGMIITKNTTFCKGTYNMSGPLIRTLILINTSDITLD